MYYLDKRDKNGLLLSYSAFDLADEISNYCFKEIEKTEIYEILAKEFQKKYLEMYFKTFFYINAVPIAHKVVLNEWEATNKSKNFVKVNIKLFPIQKYLKDFFDSKNINFVNKIDFLFIKTKALENLRLLKSVFLKKINFSKKNQCQFISDPSIAVCYNDGLNLDKRSDIFWLKKSKINPENIILYFENKLLMNRHGKDKILFKKLDSLKINYIKLWELENEHLESLFQNIIEKLKKLKIHKKEIKNLQLISINLMKRINFWFVFFKKFNVKIHTDPKEYMFETIIKQLALRKLDGCSIGKLRSHIGKKSFELRGSYPNDVFFVPSSDAATRFKEETYNSSPNLIISGFPYNYLTKNNIIEQEKIKKFFSQNKKNFIILLLDSNYSNNMTSSENQMIFTDNLRNFYNVIFDTFSKFEDVGIIIKTKKNIVLKNLKDIYEKAKTLEKKGFCYIVEEPFNKFTRVYSSLSDVVISASAYYPSSLMECISEHKRGVFCDYANMKFIEQEWYKWGEKKVIFNDVNELANNLIKFKKDKFQNKHFGNWEEQKNTLDPYKDNFGGDRIGMYMSFLYNEFKNKKKSSEAILNANKKFSEKWGTDKVIFYN